MNALRSDPGFAGIRQLAQSAAEQSARRPARLEIIDAAGDPEAARLIDSVESAYAGTDTRSLHWNDIRAVLRRCADRARTSARPTLCRDR